MAVFRSVKTLVSRSIKNPSNCAQSRAFFSLLSSSRSPIQAAFLLPTDRYNRRVFLFRSRFLSPVWGPLFLSNPPWKLSQSAAPLLLQSDAVLSFLRLRALHLLRRPALTYSVGYDALRPLNSNGREVVKTGAELDVVVGGGGISDSYLNLPNFISFTRLLSGPLLAWMITREMYSSAFIGLAISGASDWLDGFVARKMRINSVVGSYLDPLADKVLIGCVALAMVDKGLLNPGVVALVVLRDVALVGGAVYKRAESFDWKWNSWQDFFNLNGSRIQKVEPLLISKIQNSLYELAELFSAFHMTRTPWICQSLEHDSNMSIYITTLAVMNQNCIQFASGNDSWPCLLFSGLYPRMNGRRRPLRNPAFVKSLFADEPVVVTRPANISFAAPPAERIELVWSDR